MQTDTSTKGLGACLLQEKRPIYLASKALTETQRGYVVIEIESLAVAWAMEIFHHFLYASHFILETDQKQLEAILLKSPNQAPPRLQRILIKTFPYNFTVHNIPGVTNQLVISCQDWETRRTPLNFPNSMCIRLHNTSLQEVIVCIN